MTRKTHENIYADTEKLMVVYRCKAVTKGFCKKKTYLEI